MIRSLLRRTSLLAFALIFAALFWPALALAQDGGDVITPNTDLAMWSLLVGAILPTLVSVIQQPRWPSWFRAVIGVASSVVAGFVTTYLTESAALWDQGMVHAILLVGVASWSSYQSFWKPTAVAPKIEEATALPTSSD